MRNRLPFESPSIGDRVIQKMTGLKIHLLRHVDESGDENIFADYEIEGQLRIDSESDSPRLDVKLLAALLCEFSKPMGKGGAA